MDGKMKGMIMAGMMGLALILGILGALGNTWLVPDTDEDMDGNEAGAGLTSSWFEMDLKDMGVSSQEDCETMAKMMEEDAAGESECDGTVLMMTMPFSDGCDDGDDEACEMATSGMVGTIGMWAGIVCALIVTLSMVLPMAGVDAMDAMPDIANKITSWGAGGLMLVGMLGWYFLLPDGGESALGMSGWMAGAAMTIALGSTLIGQFIPSDE